MIHLWATLFLKGFVRSYHDFTSYRNFVYQLEVVACSIPDHSLEKFYLSDAFHDSCFVMTDDWNQSSIYLFFFESISRQESGPCWSYRRQKDCSGLFGCPRAVRLIYRELLIFSLHSYKNNMNLIE